MPEKNVIQLTTTTTTSGTYLEITVPDGLGGYVSRKIAFNIVKDAVNLQNSNNKGYFTTPTALRAAFPVGENGWFAIVGSTDTVWIWDSDTVDWADTTNSGLVLSVNGLTGAVVLEAIDIDFSSAVGLSATNVRDGIDELKAYIDSTIAGAGGIFVNQSRANSGETIVAGDNTITFSDPFLTADYSLIIQPNDDLGLDLENIVKTVNGFTVNAINPGTLDYVAIAKTSTGADFEADSVGYDDTVTGFGVDNLQDAIEGIFAVSAVGEYTTSFVSGDLSGGILAISHNLGKLRVSTIVIYDNNDKEVNKSNYEYQALTTNTGQIEFFLPISGTWNVIIKY